MTILKNLGLIPISFLIYFSVIQKEGAVYPAIDSIILLSDFQRELGCEDNFFSACDITSFKQNNGKWQLEIKVPGGDRSIKVYHNGSIYGQKGKLNGASMHLILKSPVNILFTFDPSAHVLSFAESSLETRSSMPLMTTIKLDDTLIYDPNTNMIANPADSIRYQMILQNQSGASMTGVNITRTGDPNTTIDPNFLKASPLAFNDTFTYVGHPDTVMAVMGLLSNDYDLNDPLPNPPFNANLSLVRVNGLSSNIGISILTAGGGHVKVNADGSFEYDSTGVNGAQSDTWMYTILDTDGYYDSATVLMQFNMAPVISTTILITDSICAFEKHDTFVMPILTITDDELEVESAKIQICSNYLVSEDTLIQGMLPMGVTASWNDMNGTLMLMGSALLMDYESAIEQIQYLNSSNNPNTTTRRICVTVNDGSVNSNQVTRELKIKPVNDCPTAVRDTLLVNENGSNMPGNVISNDTDPENDALTITMFSASTGGTLNISSIGDVTFNHSPGLDTLNVGQMFFARAQYAITDISCTDTDSVIIKITGINDAPTADSNKYSLAQTNTITVPAPGILSDDDDIDNGSTILVGEVNGSAANVGSTITLTTGAELNVSSNGSFIYNPKCLVAGLDSFTYKVKDEHNALSSLVTVYLQISQTMWFVDDVGVNGAGSFNSPFNTFTSVESQSQPGDYVFLFPGTYTQNLLLKNNQKLIGAIEDWNCPSGTTIRMGTASDITNFQGELTLAMNDTVKGINFTSITLSPLIALESRSSTGSIFIKDNNVSVGNLFMSNNQMTIVNTARCGFVIKNGGSLNVSFIFITIAGTGQTSVDLNSCNGNMIVSAGTMSTNGDTLVNIKGGQMSATFDNSFSQMGNFPMLTVADHTTGTLTFQTGTVSATSGTGLQFNNADGTYNFFGTTILAGGDAGVDIINGSDGNFMFNSTSITNPANTAFLVNGGAGSISQSGGLTKSSAGRLIDIQSRTGGSITINGNLSSTGTSTGINVSSCTGGTITFAGGTKSMNTPGSNPVNLASNTGATINFTNGGLAITSTTATGFNATGGGTVSVQGTANTITSTTGIGLNVNATSIGASNLNFQSIASNGSTSGITLNNTGTSGGLVVTGDAGTTNNSSGGTIQNTTGDGISLINTNHVSFDQMNIQTTGGSGINGTMVNNFTCTNSTINNSGNATLEANISFNGLGTGSPQFGSNITGILTVTGNSLINGFSAGLDVQCDNGTLSNAILSNNVVTNSGVGTAGLSLGGTGNAVTSFNLTKATITNNTVSSAASGGIQVSIGNSNASGPGATAGTPNDATNIVTITGNNVTLDPTGTNAIIMANSGGNPVSRTKTNFNISNNGSIASPLGSSSIGTVILIGNNGYSDMTGTCNNNFITAVHTPNLGGGNGIAGGNGVAGAGSAWTPDLTLTCNNNSISGTDGNGILLVGRSTSGIAKLTIRNNTIGAPVNAGGSARTGIRIDAGNSSSTDDAVCLDMTGNTSAGSNGAPGLGIRKQGTVAGTNDFGVVGFGGGNCTAVENFIAALNPGSVLGTNCTAGSGRVLVFSGDNFVGCNTAPPVVSLNSKK